MVAIYTLSDPRTGCVRYVGQAINPDRRFYAHKYESKVNPWSCPRKAQWLGELLSAGIEPIMEVVKTVTDEEVNEAERQAIADYRGKGCDLTNRAEATPFSVYSSYTKFTDGGVVRLGIRMDDGSAGWGYRWEGSAENKERIIKKLIEHATAFGCLDAEAHVMKRVNECLAIRASRGQF